MKKIANEKLGRPAKFLRRVLSKTSDETLKMQIDFESEIGSLKQQISKLQFVVNGMQNDNEKREEEFHTLECERNKLSNELNKERRENKKLKQQLDDEREFYYREKESYCKEMNECKKLKKRLSKNKKEEEMERELLQTKREYEKLKDALNKTMEGNYNLCVKFLRMKNTKHCLKNRLKTLQITYNKFKNETEQKMNVLHDQLEEVLNNHLKLSIHPSNRRYLQVVKQSNILIHENMCLKIEVDRLTLEIERMKMMQIKKETDSKLKFINSKTRGSCSTSGTVSKPQENKHVKKKENAVDDLLKDDEVKPVEETVTKLFERNKTVGTPTISIMPSCANEEEKCTTEEKNISVKKKKEVSKSKEKIKSPPSIEDVQESEISMNTFYGSTKDKVHTEGSGSELSFYPATEATRTQSAPEVVQSSCFINQT